MKIAPQSGVAFRLSRGQELHVIDPEGQQVADLFCISSNNLNDAFSPGRSIDYNETIRFTLGHKLFANSENTMLEIVEDTCSTHDFLVTPCSLQMFYMMNANREHHPSCQDNLVRAFAPFVFTPSLITITFNIFMNVTVEAPRSKAGDFVRLKAERDLIVSLPACSDQGSNAGRCKGIQFEIHYPQRKAL